MPQEISFKKKLIINLSVSLAIIVAFIFLLVLINGDLNKRREDIVEHKREINSRTMAVSLLADLKKDAEKASPLISVLENRLPTRDELILFPRELTRLANDNNIELGFAFGSESPGSDEEPGVVGFTLSLSGEYDNLAKFLSDIEKSRYYIRITTADLTRKSGEIFGLITSGEVYIRGLVNGEIEQ